MRILLDMDGVLTDFDGHIAHLNGRKANGKCDWDKITTSGSDFWVTMPWLEEGHKLYNWIMNFAKDHKIEVGILSAIFLEYGKQGKRVWLENNCPEINPDNIIICNKGYEKWKYATSEDILIDDDLDNIVLFRQNVGNCIHFKTADETIEKIKHLFSV